MVAKKEFKIEILDKKGSVKGSLDLNPEVFGAHVNKRLLDLVVTAYAANKRQGNASTKERGAVRGGGKKPWKQKGTGRARCSSIRSPIWVGGGTVFGPHPRDYRVNLPRTMRNEALRSALSLKFKNSELVVVDDLAVAQPKTKEFVAVLKALKLTQGKALCIVDKATDNLVRASNNVPTAKLTVSKDVTAYDILRKKNLLIEKSAIAVLEGRLVGV